MALGLLARFFIALLYPNFPVSDEIYQYFGQAHRLVFGHSVVPWEFEVGLRSWLIPLLLAGPMEIAKLVDPAPWFGIACIKLLTSVLSMTVVMAAMGWGWKFRGVRGAAICGTAAAFWPDLLVMAPHPDEDTLGAYVLLAALYLIEPWPAGLPRGRELRRATLAGGLLGLSFVLRNPLAPGIAIAGIALCRKDPGKWAVSLVAGGGVFLLAGLLDWATWGVPFRSFIMNYRLNVTDGAASFFGTKGNFYYPEMFLGDWLWALPFIIIAIGFGISALPVTSLAAFAIMLVYLATPHKEFRFLFPSIAPLVAVFGIGLVRMLDRISRSRRLILVAILASGLAFSVTSRLAMSKRVAAARAEMALYPWHPARVGVTEWDVTSDLFFGAGTRLVAIANSQDFAGVDGIVMRSGRLRIPSRFHLVKCFRPPYELPKFLQKSSSGAPSAFCAWRAGTYDSLIDLPPMATLLSAPPQAHKFILRDWRQDMP